MKLISPRSKTRLVSNFFEEFQSSGGYLDTSTAERKLLFAVVVRAMFDAIDPAPAMSGYESQRPDDVAEVKAEALVYVFEDGMDEEIFSFMWCLNLIASDPKGLAKKIRNFVTECECPKKIDSYLN